jgi:glycosyltransferase involved in cell wall biosynthesis
MAVGRRSYSPPFSRNDPEQRSEINESLRCMKIAQVAPLYESVPPKLYGGTERIVSFLTEELVRQGHDVTLFASGDSLTAARLVPVCPRALRLDSECRDQLAHHILLLDAVLRRASKFDIIHFHIDYLHFPLSRSHRIANLTTLHGRLDLPDLQPVYNNFQDMPVVSISNAQRNPIPQANWQATIYHGLPRDRYVFHSGRGEYLAFLGRISPEKGVDQAIQIARLAGMKLKIAAKVDPVDREYFRTVIRPLLQDPLIEFVGEIGYPEKNAFLGGALALLFPIDWPEPFGLVMIEAMACGTPVVAYRRGSVPEIIENGITGFIVDHAAGAAKVVNEIGRIDRRSCRQCFEKRFTVERMAAQYLEIYRKLLPRRRHSPLADAAGRQPLLATVATKQPSPALDERGESISLDRDLKV